MLVLFFLYKANILKIENINKNKIFNTLFNRTFEVSNTEIEYAFSINSK